MTAHVVMASRHAASLLLEQPLAGRHEPRGAPRLRPRRGRRGAPVRQVPRGGLLGGALDRGRGPMGPFVPEAYLPLIEAAALSSEDETSRQAAARASAASASLSARRARPR
jgi:hypothetical protein